MTGPMRPNLLVFANSPNVVVWVWFFFFFLSAIWTKQVDLVRTGREPELQHGAHRGSPSLQTSQNKSSPRQGSKCSMFYICLDASVAFKPSPVRSFFFLFFFLKLPFVNTACTPLFFHSLNLRDIWWQNQMSHTKKKNQRKNVAAIANGGVEKYRRSWTTSTESIGG